MYIGKLNDRLTDLAFCSRILGTDTTPITVANGNPLFSEVFSVDWRYIFEKSVEIKISWSGKRNINDVVLHLGADCTPTEIRVRDANSGALLCKHTAETGENIDKRELTLPVEAEIEGFCVEFDTYFSFVTINGIDIYGAELDGIRLFPEPSEVEALEGSIRCDAVKSFSADSNIAKKAALILCEKWSEKTGAKLSESERGEIRLLMNKDIAENGYTLDVSGDGIVIKASDLRGMICGVESLIKLILDGKIAYCRISDAPRMPFRGIHLMIPPESEFEFTKRLIKYVISPMGYNAIIFYIGGAMQYESHPEINEAMERAVAKGKAGEWPRFAHDELGGGKTVPKAVIKDFVDYCRSFGIEVIPEVQSLGHVQFMTEAYPEIAERAAENEEGESIDNRNADTPASSFYAHCYCPQNPKSYEILFDLLDEVIELFAPCPYVHMGHDEVYQLGICPKCKDKDRGDLFADDVNKIYAYLKQKGSKMMIWSDMIQTVPTYRHRAIGSTNKVPKDIICLDFIWYFNLGLDIEDNLLAEGFKVAFGNLYSSHFPRYESRIAKDGVIGGQVSAWTRTDEASLGREGKIYDFIMTSELLWSDKYTSHTRFSYDKLIREMMPEIREKLSDRKYPSRAADALKAVIADNGEFIPESVELNKCFECDTVAKSLIFEHTATKKIMRYPWVENDVIGDYVISFEDGTSESIPVTYAGILTYFRRRQGEPFAHKYYRHNGYSATYFTDVKEIRLSDGGFCSIFAYEWINPTPEKKIKKIEYISNGNFDTDVYIRKISAIN